MCPGSSFETPASGVCGPGTNPKRQVRVDRLEVELGPDEAAREQALELGREDEDVADAA